MSKSLIYTALTAPVDVLAGGAIPLGTIIRRYGCAVNLNGNGIALSDAAYYRVSADVVVAATDAGEISATLLVDGVPYPGAIATETATAAGVVTLPIDAIVRVGCCDGIKALTLQLSAAGTVQNVAVSVERV